MDLGSVRHPSSDRVAAGREPHRFPLRLHQFADAVLSMKANFRGVDFRQLFP
jgi:hypothetical protein